MLNDLSFGAEPGLHERGELRKFKSARVKIDARRESSTFVSQGQSQDNGDHFLEHAQIETERQFLLLAVAMWQ